MYLTQCAWVATSYSSPLVSVCVCVCVCDSESSHLALRLQHGYSLHATSYALLILIVTDFDVKALLILE